jgi:hypothetical protein
MQGDDPRRATYLSWLFAIREGLNTWCELTPKPGEVATVKAKAQAL